MSGKFKRGIVAAGECPCPPPGENRRMHNIQFWGETLRLLVELAATVAFALSGILMGARMRLDAVGVAVVGFLAAFGGGTLRDLLLNRTPFWFTDPGYLVTILCAAAATMVYLRWRHPAEGALQVADAIGLALFSISGAQIAERAELSGLIVVVLATITGTFGGVIRDVLCNDIPLLMRRGSIYGTAVIAGASVYVIAQDLGSGRTIASVLGMLTIAGLRLAAIAFGLTLPVLTIEDRRDDAPHDR